MNYYYDEYEEYQRIFEKANARGTYYFFERKDLISFIIPDLQKKLANAKSSLVDTLQKAFGTGMKAIDEQVGIVESEVKIAELMLESAELYLSKLEAQITRLIIDSKMTEENKKILRIIENRAAKAGKSMFDCPVCSKKHRIGSKKSCLMGTYTFLSIGIEELDYFK